jgi:hypothetical protein
MDRFNRPRSGRQRIALPITIGSVRYPGIKIHETRIIRLLEVLLHGGSNVSGWTSKQIHQAVLSTFSLAAKSYTLNKLRYDLRKLKGHALLQRDGKRYAYRLTPKGHPSAPEKTRLWAWSAGANVKMIPGIIHRTVDILRISV